jgi:hypothetical protein
MLNSVVLASIDAPGTVPEEPSTFQLTVTDPLLFGLEDALLTFRLDGPTDSQILLTNIAVTLVSSVPSLPEDIDDVGPVDVTERMGLNLDEFGGERWFRLETVRPGLLSLTFRNATQAETVQLTLYRTVDGEPVLGTPIAQGQRIVHDVAAAGEVYYVRLNGAGMVDIRLLNSWLWAAPDPITRPSDVTLSTLGVEDAWGPVALVEFYRGNQLLGVDEDGSDGWSWIVPSDGWALGEQALSARAQDVGGNWSPVVVAFVTVENAVPVLDRVLAEPEIVTRSAVFTLSALDVHDPDGQIVLVEFYRDANGDGIWDDEDLVLGSDEDGSDGWSLAVATDGWELGEHVLFARALDNDGAWSEAARATVTVIENLGPVSGTWVRRFDFNSPGSPTQGLEGLGGIESGVSGYTGVLPVDLWDDQRGFGWISAPFSFSRGGLSGSVYSDLLRDGAWHSAARDFRMRLEPERQYVVTVTFGDAGFARNRMNVSVVTGSGEGAMDVATAAGQFVHRSFLATSDELGDLTLRFTNGGGDPYWTVNAVEVHPVLEELNVSREGGAVAQQADGTTVDAFTISGYTPQAWYTVSTTMGRVATADADPRYAGVQVQAPSSGTFEIQVQRGTGAGEATVRVEQVNGASRGSVTQQYVHAVWRRFDFNGSAADTQADTGEPVKGWWNVRGGDVYSAAVGHGWNGAVNEFQRGAAGISEPLLAALYRDGHWQSAPRTFQVAVDPEKTYDVRIHTGDRSFARNQLQVTVEGVEQPLVATAANEFKRIEVSGVTAEDGILDIQIANVGGDPYWVINGIEVAESGELPGLPEPEPDRVSSGRRFDFNTSSMATATGFTGVGTSNAYDPALGYGWQTNAPTFSRSGPNALLQDGHWGTSNTFLVNVPGSRSAPQKYIVNVTLGDANFARNNISIWAEDIRVLTGLATAAGQFIHRSFEVEVRDGQLNVQIASTGGDPYFTINALEVIPTDDFQTATVTAPSPDSPLPANALDVDAFQIAEVQAGIYTVQVDLGTIVSADVAGSTGLADGDGSYAGFQVVVPSGQDRFHVNVRRPSTGGISALTVQRIDGTESGSATQDYSLLPARRFDFNGSAGATQTGFTGVRGNQLYNAANGYGWTVAVPEFQRGETGYSVAPANVPLYRDGHWGSAARTFQVAVDPDKTYDVRVYVGDRSFARNLIQVTVEGAPTQHNSQPNSPRLLPSTTANGFVAVTIVGGKATDGVLDITIANTGGDPYWVINGIDVWQSDASDPGALNLLAGQWGSELVGQSLTQEAIDAVLPLAREYWVSTGLADWQLPQLYQTPIAIGDLSYRGALGVSKPEGIWLDASGAGLGWNVVSSQWSVVSSQWSGAGMHHGTTAHGQLPTAGYDLLTVVTHELGHVLGYDDLDAHDHPNHIMAGLLQPGAGRVGPAAGGRGPQWVAGAERDSAQWIAGAERDSGSAALFGPAAGGRGPQWVAGAERDSAQWVAGAERDSGSAASFGPAAGGRGPLAGGRGPMVDRVIDDLLRDDLRGRRDAWQRDGDDDFERLLASGSNEHHDETDDFFAQF